MRTLMTIVLLIVATTGAALSAEPFGIGVSGGALIPVAQEDQGTGSLFGLKFRIDLSGLFALEPNLNFGSFGDAEIEGVGSRDGSSLKHYGVDITFGNRIATEGFKPYLFLGGGIYNTKRDGDDTTNKSGWSFGGGLALGLRPQFDIDIRGRFNIAGAEGSASKKSFGITIGVTYYAGLK